MSMKLDKIIFVIAVLTLCGCTAVKNVANDSQSSNLPDNSAETQQKLLFVSNQDGDREIYRVDFDGKNLIQLTNNRSDDYDASWSPSGNKILFTSNRDKGNTEVYLMNADGSEQVNLSQSKGFDGRARWSPDGRSIVFNSDRNGQDLLFVYSLEDNTLSPLPVDGVFSTAEAVWSPDGDWIAFQGYNQFAKSDIWLVKADGSQSRQLTNNPKSEDSRVSWSPDGRKLAYHSRRDHKYNIYIYDLERDLESQVTDLPTSDVEPHWSHNGNQLLFLSTRGQFGRTQLCLMKEDGTQQRCLTDERYQIADPIWLDNDQGILHSNWFGSPYSNIYLLDVNSSRLSAISPAKGYQSEPKASPAVLPHNVSYLSGLAISDKGTRRNL
jgi:TolB protein